MKLNFSNEEYKKKAMDIVKNNSDSIRKNEDVFMDLIKGISKENLSNLCALISITHNISYDEAYNLIQTTTDEKERLEILEGAYRIIGNGRHLGNNIVSNTKINTSSWLSHSLYEALLSSKLAELCGLNKEFAFNYGLMHDYGRKFSHDFTHVIKGFEALTDLGYNAESKATITHSFINAGRYCNNEIADQSFYLDENGKEHFSEKDEITEVLENSEYSDYDRILNIADLMATDFGIVSPSERIKDIATRRIGIDESPNRKYFLASFTNLLIDTLRKINIDIDLPYVNINNMTLEEVKEYFETVSETFYNTYNNKVNLEEGKTK